MAPTTVARRCPTCGGELTVALADAPPTQWFPCPHCRTPVAVVVPRDPPPLYSWEVVPGLYPTLPLPRRTRWRARRAAAIALIAVVVLAVGFASTFAYYGVVAGEPGSFPVNGIVERSVGGVTGPAAGATVVLTEEGGAQASTVTLVDGAFAFAGVPGGSVSLNVSLPGFAPVVVSTFVSAVYDAGTTGLEVVLAPGATGNATTVTLSPFSGLEGFLASIGVAVVLFVLIAGVAAAAAVGTVRADRPSLGVVGGGAGLLAPVAVYLLALGSAFPLVTSATAAVAGFGAFALALRAVELAQASPAPGPE